MTKNPKDSPRFGYGFPFVGIVVLVVAAVLAAGGGFFALIPVIMTAALLWAIIWIVGSKIGDAFADWLEKRWDR
jgi:hypothetical protein